MWAPTYSWKTKFCGDEFHKIHHGHCTCVHCMMNCQTRLEQHSFNGFYNYKSLHKTIKLSTICLQFFKRTCIYDIKNTHLCWSFCKIIYLYTLYCQSLQAGRLCWREFKPDFRQYASSGPFPLDWRWFINFPHN